ncbi:hypothetical protein JTB14_033391 [Gonioctena quinquepunctata]|nr:hypothetical protein JTB14_033391 [Gonioctena quinquepunctata]
MENESIPTEQILDIESKQQKSDESLQEERIAVKDSKLSEETKDSELSKEPEVVESSVQEVVEGEEEPVKTKTRQSPKLKMDKETQEAIKSCFDFDEDEEDDQAIFNTTAAVGRKIPRVIPLTERRKSDILDDVLIESKEEILKTSESFNRKNNDNEEIDSAFKELMEATEVPELPQVRNTLKCEQNFHSVKTIKFPDKPEEANEEKQKVDDVIIDIEETSEQKGEFPLKPKDIENSEENSSKTEKIGHEVATKLTNPKKRFVKCFEDFELMQNEIRKKEEEKESKPGTTSEKHLEEIGSTPETKTDGIASEKNMEAMALEKSNKNVEKELETIFGPSLSKTPDCDEDSLLDYCCKTKIMSSIIEEANINEESRSKIMSKMQKKHHSPRSKILESYFYDKSKDDDSLPLEKMLMRKSVPPKKNKWTRRQSHPKKDRPFFMIDDSLSQNESRSNSDEISQAVPRTSEVGESNSQTLEEINDTSSCFERYPNQSGSLPRNQIPDKSSEIEDLLETLESSNEGDFTVTKSRNDATDSSSLGGTEKAEVIIGPSSMEGLITKEHHHQATPQEAITEENKEITNKYQDIRKEHTSEDEPFPFNVLSPSERDAFSPIGNASRVLPDDAICLPPKKNKKRKKSRHKSSRSKRRRKHSDESEQEMSVENSFVNSDGPPIDSAAVAETTNDAPKTSTESYSQAQISDLAQSPIDDAPESSAKHAAEDSINCYSVSEHFVKSSDKADSPTVSSGVVDTLIDRTTVSDNSIESKCSPSSSTVQDGSVDNLEMAESQNEHSPLIESSVVHSTMSENTVDSAVTAKKPAVSVVDTFIDSSAASQHSLGSSAFNVSGDSYSEGERTSCSQIEIVALDTTISTEQEVAKEDCLINKQTQETANEFPIDIENIEKSDFNPVTEEVVLDEDFGEVIACQDSSSDIHSPIEKVPNKEHQKVLSELEEKVYNKEEWKEKVSNENEEKVSNEEEENVSNEVEETVSKEVQETVSNEWKKLSPMKWKKLSPMKCKKLSPMNWKKLNVSNEVEENVSNEEEENVSNQLEETVSNEVEEIVSNEVQETVSNQLEETVSNEVEEIVSNEVEEIVSNEVEEIVSKEADEKVFNEEEEKVSKEEEEKVPKKEEEKVTKEEEEKVPKEPNEITNENEEKPTKVDSCPHEWFSNKSETIEENTVSQDEVVDELKETVEDSVNEPIIGTSEDLSSISNISGYEEKSLTKDILPEFSQHTESVIYDREERIQHEPALDVRHSNVSCDIEETEALVEGNFETNQQDTAAIQIDELSIEHQEKETAKNEFEMGILSEERDESRHIEESVPVTDKAEIEQKNSPENSFGLIQDIEEGTQNSFVIDTTNTFMDKGLDSEIFETKIEDSNVTQEYKGDEKQADQTSSEVTEQKIESDGSETGNDSFETVQSKSSTEIDLLEQEVVQEVIVDDDYICNTAEMSTINESGISEGASKVGVDAEQYSLEVELDGEKVDELAAAELMNHDTDKTILEKLETPAVVEQPTEEMDSGVDGTGGAIPTQLEKADQDQLKHEIGIVEQEVTSETESNLEVIPDIPKEKEPDIVDNNKEINLVDNDKNDAITELISTIQEPLQIEPEKIEEEVITNVKLDEKLREDISDKPADESATNNKLEVKCVSNTEDEFKFSIQTNLSNLTSREEISAIALATLAEIKTDFENSDSSTSEDILPKRDRVFSEKFSEPELVTIEGNLTVVSEKDLADGQVEITSEKVISSKKPVTLSSFSMDYSDSTNDSTSTNDTSSDICKYTDFEPKGTEFTSRAITKELRPKSDTKKANTYERYELLDILEGNSNDRKAEQQAPKKPFDDDMCDFEEHIPSQIVCSSKFKQDIDDIKDEIKKKEKPLSKSSIMSTTSKLLERLNESKCLDSAGNSYKTDSKTAESTAKATMKETVTNVGGLLVSKTNKLLSLKPKSIIISEQMIKASTETSKAADKPKNMLNDIEDVEAFVIHKDMKKHVQEEPEVDMPVMKPFRGSRRKTGKANILQQTIITPEGEIIQPTASTTKKRGPKQIVIKPIVTTKTTIMTPPASKPTPTPTGVKVSTTSVSSSPATLNQLSMKAPSTQTTVTSVSPPTVKVTTAGLSVSQDDNIFDINSMPIVLSDEILTPESIENMPIVIGSDASSGKVPAQEKELVSTIKRPVPGKMVSSTSMLLTTKAPNITPKTSRPRILQTAPGKPTKQTPLLPSTTKPGKYIIVPQGTVPQGTTATKFITKKTIVKRSPMSAGTSGIAVKSPNPIPEPSGNKIMIVTNQQGQQQRLLLTPAQQKMLGYQTQGTKLTKTVIKGAVLPKGIPISKAGAQVEVSTSKLPSLVGQKLIIDTSGGQSLMASTSQVVAGVSPTGKIIKGIPKQPVIQKKPGTGGKTPKTILITSKQGHTVKKITTTEDDIEKQVAEQLEAIKARSAMKLGPLPKPVSEPMGCKPMHKTPSRRSYPKKADSKAKAGSAVAGSAQPQMPRTESLSTPPPLVAASRKVPVSLPTEVKKPPTEEPKPQLDRPLKQLVIQDGMGNQTTITEGQILALPSETLGGHPQSYMLVTLDESGNLTPLNNEALLSLDPNLGMGGDLSNMVLQIDQGANAGSGAEQSVPLAQPATVKLSNPGEALRAGTSKIDIPVDNAPVAIPVASTGLQETVIDQRITQNMLSIPETPVGMQPLVPSSNGEPGQQLIVTGDPIATQKFLESLTEGTTDLANIIASAEGKSILIQADGQQILINTNSDNQMLLSVNNDNVNVSENTEGGGNPIFATQPNKNTDILAAALADTDVFTSQPKMSAQLSPSNALYPMNVGNVLETITLNSPIMTPLEVTTTNTKKISDVTDILSQIPKNVDLPITITDPNITQTVANQQVATLMPNELQATLELTLPISESVVSTGLTSPGYTYSLPALDEGVDITHKPFNSSMPLLNDDIEEPPQETKMHTKPTDSSERKSKDHDSKQAECNMNTSRSFMEEESRFMLGGEICSSLSEPPPEMFDIPEVNAYVEKHGNNLPLSSHSTPDLSDALSKDEDTTDLSTQAESSNDGSCEIPLQPKIVANAMDISENFDLARRSDEADGKM